MKRAILTLLAGAAILGGGCTRVSKEAEGKATIVKGHYGKTPDGREVTQWTLTNAGAMRVKLIDWGATNVAIETPDRDGKMGDVVLGCEGVEGYIKSPYIGAIAGRYANRIANGKFKLDGQEYTLATNNAPHHLHGGAVGFNKVLWKGEEVRSKEGIGVKFTYDSKDGEEGYPGNLKCSVTYLLTDSNELSFAYEAETDKPTVVNLTQHNYYNLAGQGNGDILGHVLTLAADHYTPGDATLIPTGEIAPVNGTPLDFTQPHAMGERIAQVEGGYDHNFVVNGEPGRMRLAATVLEPMSGRVMEIWTDQPGIQFYTGNFLDGTVVGKGGTVYQKHYGFCLETQKYPDTPNKPSFPSAALRPGEKYKHKTVHKFYAKQD